MQCVKDFVASNARPMLCYSPAATRSGRRTVPVLICANPCLENEHIDDNTCYLPSQKFSFRLPISAGQQTASFATGQLTLPSAKRGNGPEFREISPRLTNDAFQTLVFSAGIGKFCGLAPAVYSACMYLQTLTSPAAAPFRIAREQPCVHELELESEDVRSRRENRRSLPRESSCASWWRWSSCILRMSPG